MAFRPGVEYADAAQEVRNLANRLDQIELGQLYNEIWRLAEQLEQDADMAADEIIPCDCGKQPEFMVRPHSPCDKDE